MRLMRQSLLGSWQICGRRAQHSLDPRFPYSTSDKAARGTAYHAGLEFWYGTVMNEPSQANHRADHRELYQTAAKLAFHHELEKAGPRFQWSGANPEILESERIIEHMLDCYFMDGRDWTSQPDFQVIAVEHQFTLPWIPGWDMSGTLDLALKHLPSDEVLLIDHKTTSRMWPAKKRTLAQLPQAGWYTLAWEKEFGYAPSRFAFDLMLSDGRFDRRWIDLTNVGLVLSQFTEVAAIMDLLDQEGIEWPVNPTHILCSETYCDYYDYCEYGKELST